MSENKDRNPRPTKPADTEPAFVAVAPDVLQGRRSRDKYGRIK